MAFFGPLKELLLDDADERDEEDSDKEEKVDEDDGEVSENDIM